MREARGMTGGARTTAQLPSDAPDSSRVWQHSALPMYLQRVAKTRGARCVFQISCDGQKYD